MGRQLRRPALYRFPERVEKNGELKIGDGADRNGACEYAVAPAPTGVEVYIRAWLPGPVSYFQIEKSGR